MTATHIIAPDGSLWQLVPVEATFPMLNAMGYDTAFNTEEEMRATWDEVLAAAPEFGGVAVDLNGWLQGAPSGFRAEEWFIAQTTYGDRVVLRALPDGYTYDFKTADETYIARDKIAKWMPFPDSEFTPPAADEAMGRDALIDAIKAEKAEWTGDFRDAAHRALDDMLARYDAAMRGGESGE